MCPQGSFLGLDRSLTVVAGLAGGTAPGSPTGGGGFVTDQGLISSLQMIQVSSLWISSTVASSYKLFMSLVARRYFKNAASRFVNDLAVKKRSRII